MFEYYQIQVSGCLPKNKTINKYKDDGMQIAMKQKLIWCRMLLIPSLIQKFWDLGVCVWTNLFLWWGDDLDKIFLLRANVLFLMIHIVFFPFKVLLIPEVWHKLNHLPVVTKLVSLFWLILLVDNIDCAAYLYLTGILVFSLPTKYSTLRLLCH